MAAMYLELMSAVEVRSVLRHTIVTGITCGCLALLCLSRVAIADTESSNYSVIASFHLYHGDYGTDESADIISFQTAMNYSFNDKFSAMLVIPYLYQSNNATVPIGGGHFPMQRSGQDTTGGNGNMVGPGSMGHGGGMGPPVGGHPPGHPSPPDFSDESQSGLGDVILTTSYLLLAEKDKSPNVSAEFYVKFPTADEDKGLGTGVYDYGAGVSFDKWLANWQLDAKVVYVIPGSTTSYELSNYLDWSFSSNYLLTDRLSLGMGLSGATSPFAGSGDLLEVELQGSFLTTPRTGIWAVVSFGLNDSSADYGISVYGSVSF